MFRSLLIIVLTMVSITAGAVPVVFTFTSTIKSSNVPGVAVGDAVNLRVFADNGGTTLANQSWLQNTVSSASLSVGSYSASYAGPFIDIDTNPHWFETDAGGAISEVAFNGKIECGGTDIFGSGCPIHLLNATFLDFFGRAANITDDFSVLGPLEPGQPDPRLHWSVAFVPESSPFALFVVALVVFGFDYRRRSAGTFFR